MSISWAALTFTPDEEAVRELRSSWAWLLTGEYTPVLFSILGDAFVQMQATGAVHWLNTGIGESEPVADSIEQFRELLVTEKAAEWFMPELVEQLHAAGKVAGVGQCYTYVTLPVFEEGTYDVENLNAVPAKEHFAITGQVLREIRGFPNGAKVKLDIAP